MDQTRAEGAPRCTGTRKTWSMNIYKHDDAAPTTRRCSV